MLDEEREVEEVGVRDGSRLAWVGVDDGATETTGVVDGQGSGQAYMLVRVR